MTNDQLERWKAAAQATIESERETLLGVSHAIHGKPELGFQERFACELLCQELTRAKVATKSPAWELDTAFEATAGDGPTVVAICAEYDALPVIGHACGHNVIAAAALGAMLGLAPLASELGLRVRLIGTPAEEAGNASGKILELERGAFDDVTAAIMVHPGPFDVLRPLMIAAGVLDVVYHGKDSHAAYYPEKGVNASDAIVIAQVGIGLLRQQMITSDRVHGIVTHGGDAANIIPSRVTARWMVRSLEESRLAPLRDRVLACFEAGAMATGCSVEIAGGDRPYADVSHNVALSQLYQRNAERLGREFLTGAELSRPLGSTDMGNVSKRVPSIHPFIGIGSSPAVNHQPEFAAHCITPEADRAVVDAAMAMAWTAIDLASQENPTAFLSQAASADSSRNAGAA